MERVQVYREQFELLAGPFRVWPDLQCLVCKLGALEADIFDFESKASIDARVGVEIWDGNKNGFFHGELGCSRTQCRNRYAVVGDWITGPEDPAEEGFDDYDPHLFGLAVKHILPPLPLIAFPDKTPEIIRVLVDFASSVLLSDANVAAARIRTAIEALLDAQKIRKNLKLHQRIELFREKNSAAGDQLMAMKWIGNIGAHETIPLALTSVLDGIEFFARAIELIYDPREAELERRAARINRQAGKLTAARLSSKR
jgi:hypothetical protein